jgi:hypothetical protein
VKPFGSSVKVVFVCRVTCMKSTWLLVEAGSTATATAPFVVVVTGNV